MRRILPALFTNVLPNERYSQTSARRGADDQAVLELIDLHVQDVTERRQICLVTGMKPADYHNAFRRLKRLAENLPRELRDAAVEDVG